MTKGSLGEDLENTIRMWLLLNDEITVHGTYPLPYMKHSEELSKSDFTAVNNYMFVITRICSRIHRTNLQQISCLNLSLSNKDTFSQFSENGDKKFNFY